MKESQGLKKKLKVEKYKPLIRKYFWGQWSTLEREREGNIIWDLNFWRRRKKDVMAKFVMESEEREREKVITRRKESVIFATEIKSRE